MARKRRSTDAPVIKSTTSLTLSEHFEALIDGIQACLIGPNSPQTVPLNSANDQRGLRSLARSVARKIRLSLPSFVVPQKNVKYLGRLINDLVTSHGSQSFMAQLQPDTFSKLRESFVCLESKLDGLSPPQTVMPGSATALQPVQEEVASVREDGFRRIHGNAAATDEPSGYIRHHTLLMPETAHRRGKVPGPGNSSRAFSAHLFIKLASLDQHDCLRELKVNEALSRIRDVFARAVNLPYGLRSARISFTRPALSKQKQLVVLAFASYCEDLVKLQQGIAWLQPVLGSQQEFQLFKRQYIKKPHRPKCNYYGAFRGGFNVPVVSYRSESVRPKSIPLKISTAVSDRIKRFATMEPESIRKVAQQKRDQESDADSESENSDDAESSDDEDCPKRLRSLTPGTCRVFHTSLSPNGAADDTLDKYAFDITVSKVFVETTQPQQQVVHDPPRNLENEDSGTKNSSIHVPKVLPSIELQRKSVKQSKKRSDVPLITLDRDGNVIREERIDPEQQSIKEEAPPCLTVQTQPVVATASDNEVTGPHLQVDESQLSRLSLEPHPSQLSSTLEKINPAPRVKKKHLPLLPPELYRTQAATATSRSNTVFASQTTAPEHPQLRVRPQPSQTTINSQNIFPPPVGAPQIDIDPDFITQMYNTQRMIGTVLAQMAQSVPGEQSKRAREELEGLLAQEMPGTKRLKRE